MHLADIAHRRLQRRERRAARAGRAAAKAAARGAARRRGARLRQRRGACASTRRRARRWRRWSRATRSAPCSPALRRLLEDRRRSTRSRCGGALRTRPSPRGISDLRRAMDSAAVQGCSHWRRAGLTGLHCRIRLALLLAVALQQQAAGRAQGLRQQDCRGAGGERRRVRRSDDPIPCREARRSSCRSPISRSIRTTTCRAC